MSLRLTLSDDDDLVSAELALGLLDLDERSVAEARLSVEAAFAARYRYWLAQAVLLLDGPDENPRPSLWNSLAARLSANENASPAADQTERVRFWRMATALSSLAVIVLAMLLIAHASPLPPRPAVRNYAEAEQSPLVAVLADAGRSVVTITFDRDRKRLTSAPAKLDLKGRSAELWVIPEDGTPRALGLLLTTAPRAVSTPAATVGWIVPGATLAISIEPPGGSTTGQPTGPVILTGRIVRT